MELKREYRRFKWRPSGTLGVRILGHRRFVGSHWDKMGHLQLNFMRARGLRPDHVFLDIACGSLRAGRLFIPFLDPGNYLGIERERALVEAAMIKEVPAHVLIAKEPEIVVDDCFRFEQFSQSPDFAIANSLFSHLNTADIHRCLSNLRAFSPRCVLYATFRPGDARKNPRRSTAHADFRYTPEQLAQLGEEAGWPVEYFGPWGHPTGQHMMRFG